MAKPWEKYAQPQQDGPWAKYGSPAQASQAPEPSLMDTIKQGAIDLGAGAVRGAGSIGATILYPIDKAQDLYYGDRGPTVSGLVTGKQPLSRNEERRQAMDQGLTSLVGSDPNSLAYKAGKLGGEIAGTAGTGSALAGGTRMAFAYGGKAVPAAAEPVLNAIASSGMTTGGAAATGAKQVVKNLATRATGGAITGGASAGLVDPSQAGTGAIIGAAAPGVFSLIGNTANQIGKIVKGPDVPGAVTAGLKAAQEYGYVVPPTQAKPTLVNRLIEGTAGKLTTAQNASAKNQAVTDRLAKNALGIADDVQLSPEVLSSIRKEAGKAYEEVASLPAMPATKAQPLMNIPGKEGINPKQMVYDLRVARNDADAYYKAYSRSADPEQLTKAKAAKDLATSIQTKLEDYAKSVGREDLVPAMVEARQKIAKTWTVENALNDTTGSVNALKLAKDLERGKPLSGDLKAAAQFAQQFPKAAQPLEKMGSLPQISPLDWVAGGGISAATGNPLLLAAPLIRPAARSLALSPVVQNRLSQTAGKGALSRIATNQNLNQLAYRSAPLAADR